MNTGIPLLDINGAATPGHWPGGEGIVGVFGRLGGARIQVEWSADSDSAFTPIGSPLVADDTLGESFALPEGLIRAQLIGRTAGTAAGATAFPMATHFVRGPREN